MHDSSSGPKHAASIQRLRHFFGEKDQQGQDGLEIAASATSGVSKDGLLHCKVAANDGKVREYKEA